MSIQYTRRITTMDASLEADDTVCDAAKTALMCMVSAVVMAAWLVWQAINCVIPAIIGGTCTHARHCEHIQARMCAHTRM